MRAARIAGSLSGRVFPFELAAPPTPTLPGLAASAEITFALQTDAPEALAAFE